MSDKLDLKAIKERCDAATPGPWSACIEAYSEDAHHLYTGKWVWYEYTKSTFWSKEDMDFCAHAREDVPKLLEEVEKLQRQWEGLETVVLKQDAEIEVLRAALKDMLLLIEQHGSRVMFGHATRINNAHYALVKKMEGGGE